MNKILEFGRRALLVIRILSGYEERKIRSYRLQLQKRIIEAQSRKDAMTRISEQAILKEVRSMVGEMQTLNKTLEETNAAIDEYFKPIDKSAEILVNMQLDKEENNTKEMAKIVQEEILQKEAASEQTKSNADSSNNSLSSSCKETEVTTDAQSKQQGT